MPTGYTADVQNGTVTELRDFALSCARAFGACIMMRDDPPGTPIPDQFEPSSYYRIECEKAQAELSRLLTLTPAGIAAETIAHNKAAIADGLNGANVEDGRA
jgi:hypothetical protein